MSLALANLWGFLSLHKRVIFYCLAGLALLLGILFTIDRCGTWRTDRGNEKRKANINAALANIANKELAIANLQIEVAVEKERVKQETQEHLNNINATEQTKAETNAALANLEKAKNANTTNSSVEDLEKLLKRLE